jgi:UDP-3-O-[3-hydroxymyristoyl] glucosamine N-acyltransferase
MCVEGSMALLWAASSIAAAVFVTERMCIGRVCALAQGAVVLGVFEW